MKTLIIALLISSVVSGQKKDNLQWHPNYRPHVFVYDEYPTLVGSFQSFRNDIPYRVKDTVPFIGFGVQIGEIEFGGAKSTVIIRPDSLKPLSRDTIPALFLVTDTSIAKSSAFAVKGYEVYRRNGEIDWLQKRLDSNKKPLPNTWVVWQTSIY